MKKLIALVAGEPVSINSEIIAKTWKKARKKNFFIIGSYLLFKKQSILNSKFFDFEILLKITKLLFLMFVFLFKNAS